MKIVIGNDHVAIEMKQALQAWLEEKGHTVVNIGVDAPPFDYPVIGYRGAKMVADGQADFAVLICGTGLGIGMAAAKVKGVRVCTCSEPYSAKMARCHNNANVLTFGARVIGIEMAKMILESWLDAEFEGGRHARRVAMLEEIDQTGHLAAAEE